MDKQIRTWWDIVTLDQYTSDKITPRSLRWDLGPNDGMTDQHLTDEWLTFLNQCEQKPLGIIIHRRKYKFQNIEQKIAELKELMSPFMNSVEFKEKQSKLLEAVQKIENDTKNKRLKKYTRDKKDYATNKIYKWQENTNADTEGNPVESRHVQVIQDSFSRAQPTNTHTPQRQYQPPMGRVNSSHYPIPTQKRFEPLQHDQHQ